MTDQTPKRRRGRPPKDPASLELGPSKFHLGLRLNPLREEQLKRCVEAANERARAAGIPATVTASSLVQMWIAERLDEESAKLARKR